MTYLPVMYLVAAIAVALAAIPLIKRKIPMNALYGVRIPASFESDEQWYDINAYGGRLLLAYAASIFAWGLIGFRIPRQHLQAYSLVSLVPMLGGIVLVAILVVRYGNRRSNKAL